MARFYQSLSESLVGLAMLTGLILPTSLFVSQRFHHDEALYATWALQIATEQDVWLAETAVDKPPLFIYMVALSMTMFGQTESVARFPSMFATAAMIWLTYQLGRAWYDRQTGVVAAWLLTLSPYVLCFAPTAFTDPLLVALVLASCLSLTDQRPVMAGIFLGLAAATKQQAALFGWLILMLWGVNHHRRVDRQSLGARLSELSRLLFGLFMVMGLLFLWDVNRTAAPSFLTHSATNYGGLRLDIGPFVERWSGFSQLLWYGTGSTTLNGIFLVGLAGLLVEYILRRRFVSQSTDDNSRFYMDGLIIIFCLGFLALHASFSFQVWDRYLLGLMPLLALLLARILLLPRRVAVVSLTRLNGAARPSNRWALIMSYLWVALIIMTTLRPAAQEAINGRYPIGSNSHPLQGIEQIVAYLQRNAAADSTLYHRWLGTHWRFYLWGYPYDLQFWETPAELTSKVEAGHLIAFPSWRSETEARLALQRRGFRLQELTRSYTAQGVPSVVLYRVGQVAGAD